MAPPRDGGRLPGVERGLGAGQTDGRHRGGEVDRGSEGDDGEVEVCGGLVVAGVRGDGRDVVPVRHVVAGVVLAQENLSLRCQVCFIKEKAPVGGFSKNCLNGECRCTVYIILNNVNSDLDHIHGVTARAVGRC